MAEMTNIEAFRNRIVDSGYVLDPEGTHHEFVSGMHGQKLDFDNIDRHTDPLYDEWIYVASEFIEQKYLVLPDAIVGVADGTNSVAISLSQSPRLIAVKGLLTIKDARDPKKINLTRYSQEYMKDRPDLVVVFEDVGTTGGSSGQVARQALKYGAKQVEVVTTWKRQEVLSKLVEAGITYHAIIDKPLLTFEPEACRTQEGGFCYRRWEFIPREK